MTLTELRAQLRSLKLARASGALVVRHGDTMVTYRSLSELNQAIAAVTGEIAALLGTQRKPGYVRQSRKGL